MRGWRSLLACGLLLACRSTAPAGEARDADTTGAAAGDQEEQAYEIEFVGNRSLSSGQLSKQIADELTYFARDGYPKSTIDDAAYTIERYYLDSGYPTARVDYEYSGPDHSGPDHSDPDQPRVRARFLIEEGPRCVLRRVRFEGHQTFDRERLMSFFEGAREGVFGTGKLLFVESRVSAAANAIADYYYQQGYRDVKVSEPEVSFAAEGGEAFVLITIVEGPQHRLAALKLEGDLAYPPGEIEAGLSEFIGRPFFDRTAYAMTARLEEYYAELGHADVRVVFKVRRLPVETGGEGPEVPIEVDFQVTPGPKVTIRRIIVQVEDTRESFIRSRLALREGEVFSRSAERESFRNLYRTGLFDRVTLELRGEGPERDLLVEADESPSLSLFVEPGWGSFEQARLTVGFRENNVFGSGRILRGEATLAIRARRAKLELTDPWFLNKLLTADLSVFTSDRDEPSFSRIETGVGLTVTKPWSPSLESASGYQFRRSEADNVDVVDADVLAFDEIIDLSSISQGFSYDTRNQFLLPRSGQLSKASLEWGSSVFGSELDYLRIRFDQRWFHELGSRSVLALALRSGLIFPVADEENIPIQERFFNGGENTVRSFKEDELGPKDAGDEPIGGETYSVFSAEWRPTIIGKLDGALFYDVGNVTPDANDYLEFAGLESAIGLGLRYQLPIGPLRVDGGWNPDPGDDADDFVVHFSVGMPF